MIAWCRCNIFTFATLRNRGGYGVLQLYKAAARHRLVPEIKNLMTVSAPLDPSLLVLDSGDEAFFKATTQIDDPQELRNHIQRVAKEAYEVSGSLAG